MSLRYLTSGESHGPALMAILDGLPAGIPLPVEIIQNELNRRQRGYGKGPRMLLESDEVKILGGVMDGVTIGSPIGLIINNQNHEKWKGKEIPAFTSPRPGHSDLVGAIKYGYHDLRPALERASARETAARVAIGSVCKQFLTQFGIRIGGYVTSIGEISANLEKIPLDKRSERAEESEVRCPDPIAAEEMRNRIYRVMQDKDTLGGTLEIVVIGLPPGLGAYTQWDRRLDSRLGAALLSIQAMKGIEIGSAVENSRLQGTLAQDPIKLDGNQIYRPTDRCGGLEAGVSTGQPIILKVYMKPIATTLTPQETIDLASGTEIPSKYERSDFCPVPRAVPVVESMVAFVLADALIEKLGGDSIAEMTSRFNGLRKAKLSDLPMDNTDHIWWPE
jgi:chorismate synthase